MKRIPLSFLWITVFSFVSLCPLFAQFAGGSGTEADPWQIATAEQLNSVRNYLGPSNSDKHFILTADIDLGVAPWNSGDGWVPIGWYIVWNNSSPFSGKLDGNGYSISGLKINRTQSDYQGLFGYVSYASITSLKVIDLDVWGHDNVGGVSGINELSTISSCNISGVVRGNDSVGGLVGGHFGTINSCSSTGSVNGRWHVGGLVGSNHGNSLVVNSYSRSDVSGTLEHIGGLVGVSWDYSIINNSYSRGNVTGSANSVGGLVGFVYTATVSNSYCAGNVNGNYGVGGLAGIASGSTINDCYSTGTVSAANYFGGLVGELLNSSVNNSYSTGFVNGVSGSVGGLVGYSDNSIVTNSYWNYDTSGQGSSFGGDWRYTSDMIGTYPSYTYEGWDFVNYWVANNGYPYLKFWSLGISQIPDNAYNPSPDNASTSQLPTVKLSWESPHELSDHNRQTGFKLWLGTNNPPTNIVDGVDLGWQFNFDPTSDLSYNETYYWKIVPYNAIGDAQECPVWSFTTYSSSLQYPNGNELWVSGTTRTIRWQTDNAPPEVTLYISFDNGYQWSLITAVSGDRGYYYIQVPVANSTSCKIKVAASFNENHYDVSDNAFTISSSSSHPKLVVTYPSASNIFFGVGQSINLTWTLQNVTSVSLDYSIDDGLSWIEIASGLNANSFAWITPYNPSAQCRVRVRSFINSDVCDISNSSFSISKIEILSPNGGEIITGDYSGFLKYPISWSAPGVTSVKIEYSANGGANWSTVIASTSANSGSFLWSVSGGQTINGIIRISNAEYAQIYDTSDGPFSIRNPIELINVNGGGFITNNSLFNIRWRIRDVTPSNSIYLEYSTNNSDWTRINSNPVSISSESMYWYVNTGLFNSMWLRAIENSTNRILCKSQSSFRVTDKILMIYEPNGGESYSVHNTQTISWEGEGLTNLNIFYTIDDGVSWQPIAYNVPSSEFTYNWTIPDTPSLTCRIKLQDTSFNYMNLESDSNFAIIPMQVLIPSTVQGVQIAISGLDVVISWNPVTEDVNGSPIVPDQYIVMYSQSPYANPEDYIILTNTTGLLANHADVALNMSSMFYIVVAVKFDRSNQIDVLADLASRPGRVVWKELKGKLNK